MVEGMDGEQRLGTTRPVGSIALPRAGFAAYKHTPFGISTSKITPSHVAFARGLERVHIPQGKKKKSLFFLTQAFWERKRAQAALHGAQPAPGNPPSRDAAEIKRPAKIELLERYPTTKSIGSDG